MSEEKLILTNDEYARCSRCGNDLPVTSFYRKGEDGLQSYCIECGRLYKKINASRRMLSVHERMDSTLNDIYSRVYSCDKKTLREIRDAIGIVTKEIDRKLKTKVR